MKKFLLAAVAVTAISSPAMARDGSPYVGIEGGILFDGKSKQDFTLTQIAPTASVTTYTNGARYKFKSGYDLDAIAGYDFGMFRLEGELGYKHAKGDTLTISGPLSTALSGPPAITTDTTASIGGKASVYSAMVNALLDIGVGNQFSIIAGGGAGYARVKAFGNSDSAFAYQGIVGLMAAVSPNVDIGLKYRYFRTGNLKFDQGAYGYTVPAVVGPPAVPAVNFAGTASSRGHFQSQSILASLIFNFGGVAPAPVEVAPPPPPPPPPPPLPRPLPRLSPSRPSPRASSSRSTTKAAWLSRASRVRRTATPCAKGPAPSRTTSPKAPLRSRTSAHHGAGAVAGGGRTTHNRSVVASAAQSAAANVRVASM